MVLGGETPDYIHAVFVNVSSYELIFLKLIHSPQGYNKRNAYIIGEGPLDSTVRNLYKVLIDHKCGAVVMLSNISENVRVVL